MLHQNKIHRSIDNTSCGDHSQEAVTRIWCELYMDEVRGLPLHGEWCCIKNLQCDVCVRLGKEMWKFLGHLAPIRWHCWQHTRWERSFSLLHGKLHTVPCWRNFAMMRLMVDLLGTSLPGNCLEHFRNSFIRLVCEILFGHKNPFLQG